MIDPDPSLTVRAANPLGDNVPAQDVAASPLPGADAVPVRVGVGVVGSLVVFGLIMGARSINRRPSESRR